MRPTAANGAGYASSDSQRLQIINGEQTRALPYAIAILSLLALGADFSSLTLRTLRNPPRPVAAYGREQLGRRYSPPPSCLSQRAPGGIRMLFDLARRAPGR